MNFNPLFNCLKLLLIILGMGAYLLNAQIELKSIVDKSETVGAFFSSYEYGCNYQGQLKMSIKVKPDDHFNAFSIGWSSDESALNPEDFHIEFRFKNKQGKWQKWQETHGHLRPEDSPSSPFNFASKHSDFFEKMQEIEFVFANTKQLNINALRVDVCNIESSKNKDKYNIKKRSNSCPSQPYIIPRSDWWGTLDPDELSYPNANNSKAPAYNINTTHAYIHHGASSNNYSDGADVARFYWTLHVNSNGWKDIGYNYLVDRFGNLYIARHNPNFPNEDVWGAHTSSSNPYSFAICFMGNFEDEYPPDSMVDAAIDMLAYKCNLRGLSPISTGFIVSDTIDIISGHRDAPGSATACPGDSLHSLLSQIRLSIQAKLDSCQNNAIDDNPPLTNLDSSTVWLSSDSNIKIDDIDQESGILHGFYLASYVDSMGKTANSNNGFLYDDFEIQRPEWIDYSSHWTFSNNKLWNSGSTATNTKVYSNFFIDSSKSYLFNYSALVNNSKPNSLLKFYFGIDSAHLSNGYEGYCLAIHEDSNLVKLCKIENNSIDVVRSKNYGLGVNFYHDIKIIWDIPSGHIALYVDDNFLFNWQDGNRKTNGSYLAFSTDSLKSSIDFLKIYKSRNSVGDLTIGAHPSKDIRSQNQTPASPSACIYSLAVDAAYNLSALDSVLLNIDWTAPDIISWINDGSNIGLDLDTANGFNYFSAHWSRGIDENSSIHSYEYSIGLSPLSDNLKAWTNVGLDTFATDSFLNTVHLQPIYFNIRSKNEVGLISDAHHSNGQIIMWPAAQSNFALDSLSMCFGDSLAVRNNARYFDSIVWVLDKATLLSTNDSIQWTQFDSSGSYSLYQMVFGPGGNDFTNQNIYIDVYPKPLASFDILDSLLSEGDPIALFNNYSEGGDRYIWSFGDGKSSSDFQPWHKYESSGIYDIQLIVESDYCGSDTLTKYAFVTVNTNISEQESKFPFYILDNVLQFNNIDDNYQCLIWSTQGQLLFDESVNSKSISLNNIIPSQGLYFIQIRNNSSHHKYLIKYIK